MATPPTKASKREPAPAQPSKQSARPPQPSFFQRLFAPVDIACLAYFRIAFGGLMFYETYVRYMGQGWVKQIFLDPEFSYSFLGFEWVKLWPGNGIYLHFYGLALLSILISFGFLYRVSAVLFCVGWTYTFLLQPLHYMNHFYLICLVSFLMIFVPAHRALSVDAWLRPSLRSATAPAWSRGILQAQLGIAYFYGGLAKLNHDWLHGQPMGMWLHRYDHLAYVGPWLREPAAAYFFSYGGLLLDLLVVPLMMWRRTRLLILPPLLVFHLLNSQLFFIGIFPWMMIAASLIMFYHDWFRLPKSWLSLDDANRIRNRVPTRLSLAQKATVAFVGCYLAFQLLMPLRHHLYAGNPHWTENGHRFSWFMMLRDKQPVRARISISGVKDGSLHTRSIDIQKSVPSWQWNAILRDPDLILQFCRHHAERARREGFQNVDIRADIWISLNGRSAQPLIDPRFNMAEQTRTLRSKPWVVPLTVADPRPLGNP